ncbi:ubiquinol-cytochrome-c reductase complex assembly factor 2 [Callorhinchus milii]|uniref:Mitochondrial nucleoid factor 1 n=2 Tax=Callorhinchus milii TaxID=7868 RepID=K4FTT6_CALMI|nr:ubiquinol-cytochrome-c reductase complex assembly factor 2 [Callorhinchus milii]AFK11225.1 breast cancer associated protein [Callorhinchus milii]|eukprot:gi/632953418/ref/XP_007892406.1/ PREDICTED: ubiquinol-cytochrome-c reductase complex assembly factor 2 [Callorhinchus milii]
MAATRYRRFLRLCEEWPIDRTKKGRDLGTFLRQRVAQVFREGESTQIADVEKCDQMYESLIRLNTNYYRTKFPRLTNTSFTGVTVEECQAVLATDNMKQMEEMKKGIWKKLREKLVGKPEDTIKE